MRGYRPVVQTTGESPDQDHSGTREPDTTPAEVASGNSGTPQSEYQNANWAPNPDAAEHDVTPTRPDVDPDHPGS